MRKQYNKEYYEARKMLEGIPKVCVNCGKTEGVEMHHIVPLSRGGNNTLGNIVYLCKECHYKAHSANIGGYRGGRTGRNKKQPPEGYEEVLRDYFNGIIGWDEVKKRLKIDANIRARETWWVEEYAKKNGISRYEKYIIPFKKVMGDDKYRLSIKKWYTDGRIEEVWVCNGRYQIRKVSA